MYVHSPCNATNSINNKKYSNSHTHWYSNCQYSHTMCSTTPGGEETAVADTLMNWPAEVGVLECFDRVVVVRKLSTEDDEGDGSVRNWHLCRDHS